MPKPLITRRTINDFRELLVDFVLGEIDDIFSGANIGLSQEQPAVAVTGERRNRVEQYLATLDLTMRKDAERLASAFAEVIEQLRRREDSGLHPGASDAIAPLLRRMDADGWTFDRGKFVLVRSVSFGIEPTAVLALSEASIEEHVAKARLPDDNYISTPHCRV